MDFAEIMILVVAPLAFIVAIVGAVKPYVWRASGRKEALKNQQDQNELLRQQNELLAQALRDKK